MSLTHEQRVDLGRRRAAMPDMQAARSKGGRTRAAQPGFAAHNREIAPAGWRAALASGKLELSQLLDKAAAYREAHPTAPERWVQAVLDAAYVPYRREFRVDTLGHHYYLDFRVEGSAGPLAIEPGAAYWHGDVERERERQARLHAAGFRLVPISAEAITRDPAGVRAWLLDVLRAAEALPL